MNFYVKGMNSPDRITASFSPLREVVGVKGKVKKEILTQECKDLVKWSEEGGENLIPLTEFFWRTLTDCWIDPGVRTSMTQLLIKPLWLRGDFSSVHYILNASIVRSIDDVSNGFDIAANKTYACFLEMRGDHRGSMSVLSESTGLAKHSLSIWEAFVNQNLHLDERSFAILLDKFSCVIQKDGSWARGIFQAKYEHLKGRFFERNAALLSILQFPNKKKELPWLEAVEELSVDLGDSSFLGMFYNALMVKSEGSLGVRLKYKGCQSVPEARLLLYKELEGAPFSQLEREYETLMSGEKLISGLFLQHLHFLIRQGFFDRAMQNIEGYISLREDVGLLADSSMPRKDQKLINVLRLLKAEILVSKEKEELVMELLDEVLKAMPKSAEALVLKSRMHLNPLSRFYDISLAKESLDLARPCGVNNVNIFIERIRLAYILELSEAESVGDLEMNLEDFYGMGAFPLFVDPMRESLDRKVQNLVQEIEGLYRELRGVYQIRKRSGTTSVDALACAQRIYPGDDEEFLYALFSSGTRVNTRNLSTFFSTLTPSQRNHNVLNFSY